MFITDLLVKIMAMEQVLNECNVLMNIYGFMVDARGNSTALCRKRHTPPGPTEPIVCSDHVQTPQHQCFTVFARLQYQGNKIKHLAAFQSLPSGTSASTRPRQRCKSSLFICLLHRLFIEVRSVFSLFVFPTHHRPLALMNRASRRQKQVVWNLFGVKTLFPLSVRISSFTVWWMLKNNYGESSSAFEIFNQSNETVSASNGGGSGVIPPRGPVCQQAKKKKRSNGHINTRGFCPLSALERLWEWAGVESTLSFGLNQLISTEFLQPLMSQNT